MLLLSRVSVLQLFSHGLPSVRPWILPPHKLPLFTHVNPGLQSLLQLQNSGKGTGNVDKISLCVLVLHC